MSKYRTPLLFITFGVSSLFLALTASISLIIATYFWKSTQCPLICTVFYWRQETLLKVWKNVENLKHSLSILLPAGKVQTQPLLCISLHPLEDPPKSLRTTYVSPKVRWGQSKGRSGKKEHISEVCSITNLNGNDFQIWQNCRRHFYHGNRQSMTDGRVWESFSERLCLSTDRFHDWMSCKEQPAWAVSLRELHCVLPDKRVYLPFEIFCACLNQMKDTN